MKNVSKILIFTLILAAFCSASVSRLYVGELDGQFMAGVDMRTDFKPFYVGGDVRTLIRKTVIASEEQTSSSGFLPDRTDYKTLAGISFGDVEIEYAHTCYHRVISTDDVSFYYNNKNPKNTDTIVIRWFF